MGTETKIQWCNHTFNPWRGCTKIAPGCENCYAARDAKRFPKIRGTWGPNGTRVRAADWRGPVYWNKLAEEAGERRRVFCASLADVFEDWPGSIVDHNGEVLYRIAGATVPEGRMFPGDDCRMATMDDLRRDLFKLIDETPWLDWLLVTKRPENIWNSWPVLETFQSRPGLRPMRIVKGRPHRENVWLLTSVSDQDTAEVMAERLSESRNLAPVLGISAEPMLAPIPFPAGVLAGIDWVIFGGESGPKARPCNLAWIADGLEQCQAAGIAAFMKQAGAFPIVNVADERFREWVLGKQHTVHQHAKASHRLIEVRLNDDKGGNLAELPEVLHVREFPTPAGKAVPA